MVNKRFDSFRKNYCPEISSTVSKIVHILMSLPNPSRKYLKEMEKMFFSFLWNGKPDPITRHNSYLKLESGGISMINIENFIRVLKVAWVRRIFHNIEKMWHELLSLCIILPFKWFTVNVFVLYSLSNGLQ